MTARLHGKISRFYGKKMASNWSPFYSPSKTPSKSDVKPKVGFYHHFPKDFLSPYGAPSDVFDLSDQSIRKRLKTFSCEWLHRPGYALSELAETVIKCKEVTMESELLNEKSCQDMSTARLDQLSGLLDVFWNDDTNPNRRRDMKENECTACTARIKKLQHILNPANDNGIFKDIIQSYVRTSNAMFSMSIQLRLAMWALGFPSVVAEMSAATLNNAEFRAKPTMHTLGKAAHSDYLVKSTFSSSGVSMAKKT